MLGGCSVFEGLSVLEASDGSDGSSKIMLKDETVGKVLKYFQCILEEEGKVSSL